VELRGRYRPRAAKRAGKGLAGRSSYSPVGGNGRPVAREPEDARHRDLLMYDLGQATAIMMLAAADAGIGSGHAAVADQEQARRVLGFPDGYLCVYLIGLGYPADRPLRPLVRPDRRPFQEVCALEPLVRTPGTASFFDT
jgi:nitroreductase